MLMRRSGAPSFFEFLAIGALVRMTGRAKRAPPPLKERGADISEPREGSSLGGYLAKLTIRAAVTNVTRGPFIIWTWGRLRQELAQRIGLHDSEKAIQRATGKPRARCLP
jgi:hypothetical protein